MTTLERIDITDTDCVTRWGVIGGPPRFRRGKADGFDPIFLITPDVVRDCLIGPVEFDGITGECNPSGRLEVTAPDGTKGVYELFPAEFSDGEGPDPIYLAVWPD